MKKRITVLLWILGMVLPWLVFAGGGQSASARTGGNLDQYGFKETGYPIVTQPYTLKVMIAPHSGTANKPDGENALEIIRELEKKTGIHIDWQRATNEWQTQKALVLASGDLPDIFWPGLLTGDDLVQNNGIFTQLDGLIDKYASNIKAIFRSDPAMEKTARYVDGKIWYLPMKLPAYMSIRDIIAINKTWLEKLNLKAPTTTEELYQVLKAFKERDPNGNGIADEIPASFTGLIGDQGLVNLLCAFGINAHAGNWYCVSNGKVNHVVAQDGFKDALIYFHRLYSEGLLDQELFTQNQAMLFAKLDPPEGSPDTVGLAATYWRDSWGDAIDRTELLLPVAGPKGHRAWTYSPETYQVRKFAAIISSACRSPEIAMRWLDALYEKETSLELFYGPIGLSLIKNPDGTYHRPPKPEDFMGNWNYSLSFNTGAPQYASDETSRMIVSERDLGWDDKDILARYAVKEYWDGHAPFTPEETEELSVLSTDIQTLVTQQVATWITQGGIEREYDSFIRTINSMGLPRMVSIYQTAYDRYMK
jgi:putative aldouronate transport system substrate-binding protein